MTINIMETVWNSYKIIGIDKDYFKPLPFREGLEKNYDGNIWIMQATLANKGIIFFIDMKEACFEYVNSNFNTMEIE